VLSATVLTEMFACSRLSFRYNKIEFGKNRKNAEATELSKRAKKSKA
jgi:hypothetical protein